MARTKSSNTAAAAAASTLPLGTRPRTGLYAALFAVVSGLCFWFMMIDPNANGVPLNFNGQVAAARYDNGLPMRTRYTGIAPLDNAVRFLVLSFVAGAAGWDDGVRAQQFHFLTSFFAVVCVLNVEACRRRNQGRLISFTAVWALFYQTAGGAVIIPLYYLASVLTTSKETYYTSGRQVPLSYSRSLLFAAVVGYLLPTFILFAPWVSFETTQLLTVIWQGAPLYVNALYFLSSMIVPNSQAASSTSRKNPDISHLKRIYYVAAFVTSLAHIGTIYVCLTSPSPQLHLARVFWPSKARWHDSTALGLHYIFQLDWWGIFATTLVWSWIAVYDVQRILLTPGAPLRNSMLVWALRIASMAVVIGPGATLALVWSWREDKLAMVEDKVGGPEKKPKST
ncbi:hypothetical protein F4778DRAFT_746962 [Xylariomycetidae sp. FL2044]|nr:hypothetical protein F4778DRAFT_746962 [Xylariomycetidae sp. FL2044]